jgi:negative regulator of replication initiation
MQRMENWSITNMTTKPTLEEMHLEMDKKLEAYNEAGKRGNIKKMQEITNEAVQYAFENAPNRVMDLVKYFYERKDRKEK